MQEKVDELYQEYLREKLDLIIEATGRECDIGDRSGIVIKGDNGFLLVCCYGNWNIINPEGSLLSDTGYDYAELFHEGFARVMRGNKWNFIDINGNLIGDTWYDYVDNFEYGVARVGREDEWNFINEKGKLVNSSWNFGPTICKIKFDKRVEYSLYRGGLIGNIRYDDIDGQENRLIFKVKKAGKYNFFNRNGQWASDIWYDNASKFVDGIAQVLKGKKHSFINTDFKLLAPFSNIKKCFSNKNFLIFNGQIICLKIDMGDYTVKKSLFGYTCENLVDSYKVKYRPIKRYGFRYTLCLNKDKVLLYDRLSNQYTYEWDIAELKNDNFFSSWKRAELKNDDFYSSWKRITGLEYDDHFIFVNNNKKIYFMYENQMIDITDYYNTNLKGNVIKKINSGVTILSREEFAFLNRRRIDELFKEIKEEKRKNEELREKEQNERKLESLKLKKEKEAQEKKHKKIELMKEYKRILQQLSELENDGEKMVVDNKDFLVRVGDHFEISPKYVPALKYIDLTNIKFDNVKVDGIDFSGTNLDFDPQKVYQKNLRKCHFEGVFIKQFMDFSGVDIRGCRFSMDENPASYSIFNTSFKNAIFDEETTFNGVSFIKMMKEDNRSIKK